MAKNKSMECCNSKDKLSIAFVQCTVKSITSTVFSVFTICRLFFRYRKFTQLEPKPSF